MKTIDSEIALFSARWFNATYIASLEFGSLVTFRPILTASIFKGDSKASDGPISSNDITGTALDLFDAEGNGDSTNAPDDLIYSDDEAKDEPILYTGQEYSYLSVGHHHISNHPKYCF